MNPSNDPSLTAWALDQMSAEERAAYEATLTQEPSLKANADELKDFCQFISTHVRDQKSALTLEQRQKLLGTKRLPAENTSQATPSGTTKPKPKSWWKTPGFVLPLSAAAALMVLAAQLWNPTKTAPQILVASPAADTFTEVATFKNEVQAPTTLPIPISQPAVESKIQQLSSTDSWKPLLDDRSDLQTPAIGGQKLDSLVRSGTLAKNEGTLDLGSGGTLLADTSKGTSSSNSLQAEIKSGAKSEHLAITPGTKGTITPIAPAALAKAKSLDAPAYTGDSPIVGTGGIVKTAGGTLTLSGTSTYTGGTNVIAGVRGSPPPTTVDGKPLETFRAGATLGGIGGGIIPDPKVRPTVSMGTPLSPDPANLWASQSGAIRLKEETSTAAAASPLPPAAPSPTVATLAKRGDISRGEFDSVSRRQSPPERDGFTPNKPHPAPSKAASRETYAPITENPLTSTAQQPLSTFSIDVDTAAYANVRRFLNSGTRPPADAVRIEELINYFPYDYEFPQRGEAPFTVAAVIAEAPWQPTHRLARIAIKARDVGMDRRQSNFVFLVDVSGSMDEPNKLPLVQQSLSLLTDQLTAEDRVAIVVYAGNSGLALSSTPGDQKDAIRQAIRQMKSGGSTHGSAGIRQAYDEAQKNFIQEGINRVILCTDGDFNVGTTSPEELEKLITEKAKGGVFLSVLGYGTGNTQDRTMETLADKGNGNYAYIDSLSEARKVLVDQMRGTLITVAKDVKIQIEFNPTLVQSFRLIGYENRLLAKEDFNNDAKDAGEIGAGHTVTALYEIIPVGITAPDGRPLVDPLKYQDAFAAAPTDAAKSGEMMTVKLRYKKPDGDKSDLLDFPVRDENKSLKDSEPEFRFATAVASFGLLLRDSSYRGDLTWEQVRQLALGAKGQDTNGYRGEFIQLIDKARGILGDGRP
jgi:autotransporter-associated beta strand protein